MKRETELKNMKFIQDNSDDEEVEFNLKPLLKKEEIIDNHNCEEVREGQVCRISQQNL